MCNRGPGGAGQGRCQSPKLSTLVYPPLPQPRWCEEQILKDRYALSTEQGWQWRPASVLRTSVCLRIGSQSQSSQLPFSFLPLLLLLFPCLPPPPLPFCSSPSSCSPPACSSPVLQLLRFLLLPCPPLPAPPASLFYFLSPVPIINVNNFVKILLYLSFSSHVVLSANPL